MYQLYYSKENCCLLMCKKIHAQEASLTTIALSSNYKCMEHDNFR